MSLNFLLMVTFFSFLQSIKAPSSITSTVEGMVISTSGHSLKAISPIFFTLAGIVTLFNPE